MLILWISLPHQYSLWHISQNICTANIIKYPGYIHFKFSVLFIILLLLYSYIPTSFFLFNFCNTIYDGTGISVSHERYIVHLPHTVLTVLYFYFYEICVCLSSSFLFNTLLVRDAYGLTIHVQILSNGEQCILYSFQYLRASSWCWSFIIYDMF